MPRHYSRLMIVLHWSMAALMVAAYLIGEQFEDLPRGPEKLNLLVWHIYAGLLVGLLLIPRVLARRSGAPPLPHDMPVLERIPAKAVHIGLYLVMIGLVATGVVGVTSGPQIPLFGGAFTTPALFAGSAHEAMEEAHELVAKAFLVLGIAHVLGAVWHMAVRRDGIMARMVPLLERR